MRVIVAEDGALFRDGLVRLLSDAGVEVLAAVSDPDALLAAVATDPPDVAIVDIRMPPAFATEGLAAARTIRTQHPGVAVLVLSQYVETYHALRLLDGGTRGIGYLLKDRVADLEEFLATLTCVAGGGSVIDPDVVAALLARRRTRDPLAGLTGQERAVLALMAQGRSNAAIGARLHLSAKTVETHIGNILAKMMLPPHRDDHRRVLAVLTWLQR
jgi:DNA-binding NarL/FixJ family response regulator